MGEVRPYQYSFEGLGVWQSARKLVLDIYRLTDGFPDWERYGLSSQLRRAGVSVVSNIAEGSARKNKRDQGHFYQMAYSSLMEVACQLILAVDLDFIDASMHEELKLKISEVSNKLNALHRSCS